MNNLSRILIFKIAATVLVWCIPLLLLPNHVLIDTIGFPSSAESLILFLRLLSWAYLALCVGYTFALYESFKGRRLIPTIWTGIVSNGGACLLLLIYGCQGYWSTWGIVAQIILYGSIVATSFITIGLYLWGIR